MRDTTHFVKLRNPKMNVDSMVPLESLTKSSIYPTCLPLLSKTTKEEKSSDGIAWFTAAFICPVQEIIYLAAGCEHGFCSSQCIFWDFTIKASIGAAAAVAVQALNEYSDFLPIIPNAHWMLDSLGAKHNCRYFSSVEGCCPKGLHYINEGSQSSSFNGATDGIFSSWI